MSDIEVGGRIDGKYEVLGRIGGGGMGEVYRVRHLHLEEQRVIKVMRADLARSQEAVERFSNEARLATKIKHPNVATLHDFSRLPDGSFYMVWEHIEGQDVEGWLQRRGRFPLSIALDLAIQVLAGLEVVHEEGIVHRDLSPDNLMITTDPRGRLGVKIIDLGLADQITALGELSGQVGGKLNYCSPEHLGLVEGVRPDHVSDLYSFAIVLYRMLTGVLPFPKAQTAADVAQRGSIRPRALSLDSIHQLMQRALAFDRAERFQLASDFRSVLEDLRDDLQNQQESSRHLEGRARLEEAAAALRENRLSEAEELLRDLETKHPGLDGLDALRGRLESVKSARRQVQTMQVREMLEQYLASGQKAMARLSLESLLELHPAHPDAEALNERIDALERREEHRERVERLVRQAREKLSRGDQVSAQALRNQLRDLDPEAAERVDEMLSSQRKDSDDASRADEAAAALDAALETGDLEGAEAQLAILEELGRARVTVDMYRRRIEDQKAALRRSAEAQEILRLYPEALAAGRWDEARRLVRSLEALDVDHPEVPNMLMEIDRLDQESRMRDAVSEGVSTLTSLLDGGRLEEARMALDVLLRMNGGDHPLKGHFEQRIEELASRRG